jgi:hypothetical protein
MFIMKLGSEECNEALRNYKTSNRVEELMVELLLLPEDASDEEFGAMTIKFCDELTDEEFDTIQAVRDKIDEELGITY